MVAGRPVVETLSALLKMDALQQSVNTGVGVLARHASTVGQGLAVAKIAGNPIDVSFLSRQVGQPHGSFPIPKLMQVRPLDPKAGVRWQWTSKRLISVRRENTANKRRLALLMATALASQNQCDYRQISS